VGFDLQLTQYDERGWRATFYTTRMEHSPTAATGSAWERTPWHRDAAGGVGDVEKDRPDRVSSALHHPLDLGALELPRRVAAHVEMVAIEVRRHAVAIEFDLQLQILPLHRIAANRACHVAALSAERAVRFRDGQPSAPNRLARLLTKDSLIRHGGTDSMPTLARAPETSDFRMLRELEATHDEPPSPGMPAPDPPRP
jgi:hypothetical protein